MKMRSPENDVEHFNGTFRGGGSLHRSIDDPNAKRLVGRSRWQGVNQLPAKVDAQCSQPARLLDYPRAATRLLADRERAQRSSRCATATPCLILPETPD